MMDINEIKERLNELKKEIRQKYKAEIIGIFGSFARGEEEKESDIDVLVEFKESIRMA